MDDEPRYRYRFEYRTLFGSEFTEFTAASDEDAERMFWAMRNPELNRISVVSRSPCNEEGDDGADGGDEGRPSDGSDSVDEHFAQEVLSGGGDEKLGWIVNLVPQHAGRCRCIKRLFESVFGKKD